jgi:hypothetical protein
MILVIFARDFEVNRLVELLLQRSDVTVSGPELELRIPGGSQPGQVVVGARKQVDA